MLETGPVTRHSASDQEFARTQMKFRGSWSGYERDKMFVNPDGPYPRFFDSAYVLGLDLDDDGRGAVPFDFDGDGDLDLAVLSLQGLHLFENNSAKRHFVRVRLTATKTEPMALGAVVRVVAGGVTQQNWMKLTEGFVTQIPREMHFGLADAATIDRIEVHWPSGANETWTGVPVDQLVDLREGDPAAVATAIPGWSEETRPRIAPSFDFKIPLARLEGGNSPVVTKGVPAVINFWAPWCVPCKAELPGLVELQQKYGKDVQFAGISVEIKDLASVRQAVTDFGIAYPQFAANDEIVRSFFGPEGKTVLPATFVFDATGRLRRAFLRPVAAPEISVLLDAFRENEGFAGDYRRRASDAINHGSFQEAVDLLRKFVALEPENPNSHSLLGQALLGLHQVNEGLAELQLAVRIDPDFLPVTHYNLGQALRQLGRPLEAIPELEKALRLKGDDVDMLRALALAYGEAGKVELGIAPLDRLVAKDPDNAEGWLLKGQFCLVMRQAVPSREAFERAVALDPKNVNAMLGKAQALFLEGRNGEALKAAKQAEALDPKNQAIKGLLQALEQ